MTDALPEWLARAAAAQEAINALGAGPPEPKIEMDSAGLLLHLSTCGVTDGVDDDSDCTCGAHTINQQRLNWGQPLRVRNDRLRAALTQIMQEARGLDHAVQLARVALANDR